MESFENDIFPYVGKRPVAEIKPLEMLETLRKLEARGVLDKMRKTAERNAAVACHWGRGANNTELL